MKEIIDTWVGKGVAVEQGVFKLKVWCEDEKLQGLAIAKSFNGTIELAEIEGKYLDNNKYEFQLKNHISNSPDITPLTHIHVNFTLQDQCSKLIAEWSTNEGVIGNAQLFRAGNWDKTYLDLPIAFHKSRIILSLFFHSIYKYLYLLFLIFIAAAPLFNLLPHRVSVIETIILTIPLVYFFRTELFSVIKDMRIQKAGPFEFKEQSSDKSRFDSVMEQLAKEFKPEDLTLFAELSEFFVLKTKSILWIINSYDKQFSYNEFKSLCLNQGVQEDNIEATLNALKDGLAIEVDILNNIVVSERGKDYLNYEARKMELARSIE